MSVTATRAAYKIKLKGGTRRALLDALADNSDAYGNVWRGLTQARLAEIIGCDERTVGRHMKALDAAGIIIRKPQYKHGHRVADQVIIACLIPDKMPDTVDVIPDKMSVMNPVSYPTECPRKTPSSSKEVSIQDKDSGAAAPVPVESTPKVRTETAEQSFGRFWSVYPKRDGANPKDPALRKFTALVKAGYDPEAIIAGVQAYANKYPKLIGTPYIATAIVYLNQRRWEDDNAAPTKTAASIWVILKKEPERFAKWATYCVNHPDPCLQNIGQCMASGKYQSQDFQMEWPPNGIVDKAELLVPPPKQKHAV